MYGTKTQQMSSSRLQVNSSPRSKPSSSDKDVGGCCKIVVLGVSGVGKTALIVRYMTRRFIGEYCPTLESVHKCVSSVDNEDTRVEILDTAGQMIDTECVWKDYYAFWGDCYIFVYSINDRRSFEQVINYKKHLENIRAHNTICSILVGNKADLLHDRQVPEVDAMELADEIGSRFYEVSAADWTHVEKIVCVFSDAIREVKKIKTLRENRARRPSSSMRFRQAIQKVITGRSTASRRGSVPSSS